VILFGSSTYEDPRLPSIPQVRRTLDGLASMFTDPELGICAPDQCDVVLDPASVNEVGDRLHTIRDEPDDLLILYFVGHGLVDQRGELYLALPASRFENPDYGSLRYQTVRNTMLDSRARAKVIILDCCFSGRALTMSAAGVDVTRLEVSGTLVLASSAHDQASLALPSEVHTAFSGRLIAAVTEGIEGAGDVVTGNDLFRHLRAVLRREGLPAPQQSSSGTALFAPIARSPEGATVTLALQSARPDAGPADPTPWRRLATALRELHTSCGAPRFELLAAKDGRLSAEAMASVLDLDRNLVPTWHEIRRFCDACYGARGERFAEGDVEHWRQQYELAVLGGAAPETLTVRHAADHLDDDEDTNITTSLGTASYLGSGSHWRPGRRRGRLWLSAGPGDREEVLITPEGLTVGRHSDNDLPLRDRRVSSHHAFFYFDEDANLMVRDLRSTNGVFVNRRRVRGETVVALDDRVNIADFVFTYTQH
jgi:hypothetical protein